MDLAVETYRVIVVEDHPAVSAGVEKLFGAQPDLEVAGVALGCAEATPLAEVLRPDATIVDMHLPDGNGIRLTQELLDRKLTGSVVVYTAFIDDLVSLAALIAGASAVVSKGGLADELVDAVRTAAAGAACGRRSRSTVSSRQ